MTHDELVERAVKWLKGTAKCGVAAPELVSFVQEEPDAIGWRYNGRCCIVIECKTSRADFLKDQKKYFRAFPPAGAGTLRYYMTLPGLLRPIELPKNWGLLEVGPKIVRVVRESGNFEIAEGNFKSEAFMYSLLRRAERRGLVKRCLSPKWRDR